jgi:hypothetical protein
MHSHGHHHRSEGKHGAFYFIMLFHFSSSGFVHNMMLAVLLQGICWQLKNNSFVCK